jgi:hypothetical protein
MAMIMVAVKRNPAAGDTVDLDPVLWIMWRVA